MRILIMKISLFASLVLCVACAGLPKHLQAQTAAALIPFVQQQFLDNNGDPLAAGQVFTYAGGTSTPLATYTDSSGGTPNTNPVILDGAGRASIWLGASAYRIVVETAGGVIVRTVDNVTAPTLATASLTVPSGQSLVMQSGSTSSISADWLPGAASTYNIGSNGLPWKAAWINSLNTNGNVATTGNNAFDLGAQSNSFRNLFGFNTYSQNLNSCAINGSGVMTSRCWTFNAVSDAPSNNDYMTLTDDNGDVVWTWAQKLAGAATQTAFARMNLAPGVDATYDLTGFDNSGNPIRWRDLALSRSVSAPSGNFQVLSVPGNASFGVSPSNFLQVVGDIVLPGSASRIHLSGGSSITYSTVAFAALGVPPAAGSGAIYCTDCTAAAVCGGGGTGHLAISNGANWTCN